MNEIIGGITLFEILIAVTGSALIGYWVGHANEKDLSVEFRRIFVTQGTVDAVLNQLAQNLTEAYKLEEQMIDQSSYLDAADYRRRLADVQANIKQLKKKFWTAVKMAKKNGFKVPTRTHDALRLAA